MNYHRRPATEALEHLARTRCDREIPPRRATAALFSSTSLKFGFTTLFDIAVSMQQQQQDSEFPIISWSSDDERENSDDQGIIYPEATSSNSISSDEEEKEGLGFSCKLATKKGLSKRAHQLKDGDGAYRMVRSKALHSELSLLASPISPSQSSSTQRQGVVAKVA